MDEQSGQNSIIIVPGANYGFFAADVRNASPVIQAASVLICQLEVLLEVTLEAFRVAHEAGANRPVTLLNPAPAAELPDELIRLCDVFVPNEVEAEMLTGIATDTLEGVEASARELQKRGAQNVIITLGKRGSLLAEGKQPVQVISAQAVQPVDSTGAGDAFVGSLAYFLGQKRPLRDAVVRASAIATRSVLKPGTQVSFPTRDEVIELLD